MGVGHLAIALLCRRADPAINLGVLFFAVLLADFLLGVFFWLGLETATVPAGFEHLHYLYFTFPYSHGLVASLGWSMAAMLISLALWKRGKFRSAIVILLAVFSHFILDSIVHVPGVPLLGIDSPRVGLRLWSNMKAALTLEMLLAVIGMIVFWPAATKTFRGRWGVLILVLLFSLLTIFGMTATEPPQIFVLGIGWILTPIVVSLIAFFLDRKTGPDSTSEVRNNV